MGGLRPGRSRRRVVVALLATMLGAAMISILPGAPPAAADGAPADSAMTKSGDRDFPNLKVTVSQTKSLINQTVTVSWSGGAATKPVGAFSRNFLQIMQCWGDDPNGPDRTQCQFGGANTESAGTNVQSRQVANGPSLVDPKETLALPAGTFGSPHVPFWAVGKDKPVGATNTDTNDFFDSQITNEVSLARTHSDGTGVEYFEVQTVRQAAGLGCGDPITTGGVTKGRSCWLVIVPRGSTEVNGSTRTDDVNGRLQSSPLSETNWEHRIYFPLEFLPVSQACPVGAPERRIIGHELVVDAVTSWQPALCTGGGALYSYSQLPDDVSRNLVLGGASPGLALVTNPIPPDQAPSDHPLVYAPVGLSGLAIAFNVEHQPPDPQDPEAPPTPEQELAGQRFTSMKLTPRLVAKLLTQSYQAAVEAPPASMKNNPQGLLTDPEFLDLNPDYKGFTSDNTPAPDALVQIDGADVTSLLWSWVKADPDASAFLAGKPDPSGMVINENNKNLVLPTSTFPRNDQSCTDQGLGLGVTGTFCTLDAHPFTNDMHDAGRSAARGDTKGQTLVVGAGNQAVPAKVGRQQAGRRALLAVVDAATAVRYGLPTAQLLNAKGNFVAPTTASLQAGEAAMKPSPVPGVLASDPGATDPAAYPLTALSYAVTAPSTLDTAAGKDYAAFVRYAVGPGQQPGVQPGQLPLGMAPLPAPLRAQAIAVAAIIEALGKTPAGPLASQPTLPGNVPGGAIGSTGGLNSAPGSAATTTNPGGGPSAPGAGVAPPGPSSPAPTAPNLVQQPVAVRRTPALPAPAVGALLLTILISGALAATSSPILQSPVMLRLGAAVRRLLRREATPTGQ
ncbi:MAG: hypothetical protein ACRDRO_15140 [Pseudonocardiaceae bacterium]